jgi:hypothetical protein
MTDMEAQFPYPTRTFLTRKERQAMPAVLSTLPAGASIPLIATLGVATIALALLAVYVRRLRFSSRLRPLNGALSATGASLIVAAALVISIGLGNAPTAIATPIIDDAPSVVEPAPASVLPPADDLDGYQLPTV